MLPRVSTPKPVAAPPMVSPFNTQYFHNIFRTTLKHCSNFWPVKSKTSPKSSPFLSPSPKFNSNPRPSTSYLDNNDAAFTTMHIPAKLKHLVQQEINCTSYWYINILLKINAVLDATSGKICEYKNWFNCQTEMFGSMATQNTFERLAQGRKKVVIKGTNTLLFNHPNQLPKNKKITYVRICAGFWTQIEDPECVQFTISGNLINFHGKTYTQKADLTTTKLLLNIAISTNGARVICIDLSNFISSPPSTEKGTMNMFGSLSGSSQNKSWNNMILNLSSKIVIY